MTRVRHGGMTRASFPAMKRMPLIVISIVLGAIAAIAGCRSEDKQASVSAKAAEGRDVRATRVTSKDGTQIAFDRTGKGPALILVSGALSHRGALAGNPLVAALAKRFTVYTYDRRGRGDSTDVQPYAVEREIEDLDALVAHAGGSANLFGVSSGAALAMQTAAALGSTKVPKLALYDPPYGQDSATFTTQKQRINELIQTGKPGGAAEYFLTAIGTPPEALDGMKRSAEWKAIEKIDFTLAYDYEVLGTGAVPEAVARSVTVPTLVLTGENSPPFILPASDRIAAVMPRAQRKTLPGQSHQVNADVTAPLLIAFF
jgi:pimeloyl-ACP methyl ester carboxylesterase